VVRRILAALLDWLGCSFMAAGLMVEIEGENLRPVTWVLVEEVHSGDWGIAGNGLTTADVHALQAQPAAATVG
jgi:phenylpyruvate tautomerase PptA (4-oxalocrotonate tautomerase family)